MGFFLIYETRIKAIHGRLVDNRGLCFIFKVRPKEVGAYGQTV